MNDRLAGVLVIAVALAGVATPGVPAENPGPAGEPAWQRQSEQELGVRRGMGSRLMTEQEWTEHHEKMMSLPPAERERHRREWHEKMRARAREKGIELPTTPGPHRGGPGGMGRGAGPTTPR